FYLLLLSFAFIFCFYLLLLSFAFIFCFLSFAFYLLLFISCFLSFAFYLFKFKIFLNPRCVRSAPADSVFCDVCRLLEAVNAWGFSFCRKVRLSERSEFRTLRQAFRKIPHIYSFLLPKQEQKAESAGAERTHRGLRKISP
ncbi:hypothetical protein, partial [Hungatella hominis]